jgi:hypothetical protein
MKETQRSTPIRRRPPLAPLLLLAALAPLAYAASSMASDHQDTPEVELNQQLDVNDVWAFPGSSDDRIVLAMTVASPLMGTTNARFDPNALYQLKVDNDQDGHEDLVFQFSFDELRNGTQRVDVFGPVAPHASSTASGGVVRDRIVGGTPAISQGELNTVLTAGSMQAFAGLRDDPFYIDLEQFFRIVPDRRPAAGPLSGSLPAASAFRPVCDATGQPPANPAPFMAGQGCAVDFLRGFNALAIVVELPESAVTRPGGNGQLGVWATVSR